MSKITSDMEIMQAIQALSSHLDNELGKLKNHMDEHFIQVDERFDKVEKRLDYHESRLERIETNMVTKGQFNSLVHVLRRNNVISESDQIHVSYPII